MNRCPERIHLNGIDCPEKGRAYSERSKQFCRPSGLFVCGACECAPDSVPDGFDGLVEVRW